MKIDVLKQTLRLSKRSSVSSEKTTNTSSTASLSSSIRSDVSSSSSSTSSSYCSQQQEQQKEQDQHHFEWRDSKNGNDNKTVTNMKELDYSCFSSQPKHELLQQYKNEMLSNNSTRRRGSIVYRRVFVAVHCYTISIMMVNSNDSDNNDDEKKIDKSNMTRKDILLMVIIDDNEIHMVVDSPAIIQKNKGKGKEIFESYEWYQIKMAYTNWANCIKCKRTYFYYYEKPSR